MLWTLLEFLSKVEKKLYLHQGKKFPLVLCNYIILLYSCFPTFTHFAKPNFGVICIIILFIMKILKEYYVGFIDSSTDQHMVEFHNTWINQNIRDLIANISSLNSRNMYIFLSLLFIMMCSVIA